MDEPDRLQQFSDYLERRAPGRRTTILYLSDVRQFRTIIHKPWREITMQDIDTFVDQQRQSGLQPATVKRRVAALRVFFDFLVEETGDLHWANPVRFKRHAGKQPRYLPRDLKDEAVAQVWEVIASPRDRAWFVLLWRTGMRVGELVNLKQDDVLSAPTNERPARLCVMGKGQKERIVLLSADGYEVLSTWLAQRPSSASSHIFLNDRGQPLSVSGIEWLLNRYGEEAGVSLTPHQLRHTFARQAIEAGMPITSLGKLLGHTDVTTTQIYTAGADPQLAAAYQQAMSRLSSAVSEPNPPATASNPAVSEPNPPATASNPAASEPNPSATASNPAASESNLPVTATNPTASSPAISAMDTSILPQVAPSLPDWDTWGTQLPPAVRQASLDFVRSRLSDWKPLRQRDRVLHVLGELRRFWDWLAKHRPDFSLTDVHLDDLLTYRDERTALGRSPNTPDSTLSYVVSLLHQQADRGQTIDPSVFRLRPISRSDSLPRHLTDTEYSRLEQWVRQQMVADQASTRLAIACYFVLAHSGLRANECVDLQYRDCDLSSRRLLIRQAKGRRDRVAYLSDTACFAIRRYLDGRTRQPTAPLFTHPDGRPISYHWLRECIAQLGDLAQVSGVSPHRLRHTLATNLLNAGLDITYIQKLLGHQHLSTTMIYARVLDTTLEAQYRQTMAQIQQQLPPLSTAPLADTPSLSRQMASGQSLSTQDNNQNNSV